MWEIKWIYTKDCSLHSLRTYDSNDPVSEDIKIYVEKKFMYVEKFIPRYIDYKGELIVVVRYISLTHGTK